MSLSGDFVFKGNRIVIPQTYRQTILDKLHDTHNHTLASTAALHELETCLWPNMTREIRDCISACSICVRMQNEQQEEPLMSHDAPSRAWEKVGLDLFHFRGQDYCINVDYFSNYFEIDRLQSKKISDGIYVLKQQFARHGVPSILFSYNAFVLEEFRKFASYLHTTPPPPVFIPTTIVMTDTATTPAPGPSTSATAAPVVRLALKMYEGSFVPPPFHGAPHEDADCWLSQL